MAQAIDSQSVLFSRLGKLAIASLNRPRVLNALNLEMFQALRRQIRFWSKDPTVSIIVIRGEGERGFCAGGDVKSLAITLRESRELSADCSPSPALDFFIQEYSLDYFIHTCPKPILVVSHGLTFGGGLGLFAGGSVRLVSSSSILSMPEISIGYFTDVGATYFLNRMPGKCGLFCALTAARLGPSDAIYLGLADLSLKLTPGREGLGETHEISEFLERLAQEDLPPNLNRSQLLEFVKSCGAQEGAALEPSLFQRYQGQIDDLCSGDSILEVAEKLKRSESDGSRSLPWSLEAFWAGSPTSAALIFEQLKRGVQLSLRECFDQELNLALEFCRRTEFLEGVRAQLIDKDKKPQWHPARLSDVDPRAIEGYFSRRYQIEVESS